MFSSSDHVCEKSLLDLTFDVSNRCSGVEGAKIVTLLVVFKNWCSLSVVGCHALSKCLPSVIFALHEWFSSHIIYTLDLRRIKRDMIRSAAGLMDPTTLNSLNEHLLVYLEIKDTIDVHTLRLEHGVKLFGLSNCTGESIKENTSLTLRLIQAIADEANDELVRDEFSALHDSVSLLA